MKVPGPRQQRPNLLPHLSSMLCFNTFVLLFLPLSHSLFIASSVSLFLSCLLCCRSSNDFLRRERPLSSCCRRPPALTASPGVTEVSLSLSVCSLPLSSPPIYPVLLADFSPLPLPAFNTTQVVSYNIQHPPSLDRLGLILTLLPILEVPTLEHSDVEGMLLF